MVGKRSLPMVESPLHPCFSDLLLLVERTHILPIYLINWRISYSMFLVIPYCFISITRRIETTGGKQKKTRYSAGNQNIFIGIITHLRDDILGSFDHEH